MRYGHDKAGIVGNTLREETLKIWAFSRHTFSQIMVEIEDLRRSTDDEHFQVSHKEENASRILKDKKDRDGIREKIATCIHPFDPEEHSDQIINFANGYLGPSSINVDQAIAFAGAQMIEFENSLPSGYWNTIDKRVKTMTNGKKGTKVGSQVICDTELIFSRAMGLQATARSVDFKHSTETALLKVTSDILNGLDNGNVSGAFRSFRCI
jgi:hypothetical protein